MEREAVADERTLMRDALKHAMGEAWLLEVRAEFERSAQSHDLIDVECRSGLPGRAFATGERRVTSAIESSGNGMAGLLLSPLYGLIVMLA